MKNIFVRGTPYFKQMPPTKPCQYGVKIGVFGKLNIFNSLKNYKNIIFINLKNVTKFFDP